MKQNLRRAAALILSAAVALGISGCAAGDYSRASALLDSGKYEEAERIYVSLGDYRDSEELAKECAYLRAGDALLARDYRRAAELFDSVGVYKDARERLNEAWDGYLLSRAEGKWVSEVIDLSGDVLENALRLLGAPGAERLESALGEQSAVRCVLTVEFSGATATLGYDEEALEQSLESFESMLRDVLPYAAEQNYLQIAAEKGMTLEELEKTLGVKDLEGLFIIDTGMSFDDYAVLASGREEILAALGEMCGTMIAAADGDELVLMIRDGSLRARHDEEKDVLIIYGFGGDEGRSVAFKRAE